MSLAKQFLWALFIAALLILACLNAYAGHTLNYLQAVFFVALSVAFILHVRKKMRA